MTSHHQMPRKKAWGLATLLLEGPLLQASHHQTPPRGMPWGGVTPPLEGPGLLLPPLPLSPPPAGPYAHGPCQSWMKHGALLVLHNN